MNLSKKFEELIIKQLESFGCSMGVTNLVMYLASAKQGTKASFEMIGQWPEVDRLLISIEDDPSLKVSSPNRRWYPLQENDILLGVLRVETDLKGGNWPVSLDSRLKALSVSLAKCVTPIEDPKLSSCFMISSSNFLERFIINEILSCFYKKSEKGL